MTHASGKGYDGLAKFWSPLAWVALRGEAATSMPEQDWSAWLAACIMIADIIL